MYITSGGQGMDLQHAGDEVESQIKKVYFSLATGEKEVKICQNCNNKKGLKPSGCPFRKGFIISVSTEISVLQFFSLQVRRFRTKRENGVFSPTRGTSCWFFSKSSIHLSTFLRFFPFKFSILLPGKKSWFLILFSTL